MSESKYYVTCDNLTVAENCNMETALMIVQAYFDKFYAEHDMVMAIAKWEEKK